MNSATLSVAELCALPAAEQAERCKRCCGASAFAAGMVCALAADPPREVAAVLGLAETVFDRFGAADWLDAFGHHPKIGDLDVLRRRFGGGADLAHQEQRAVAAADEATLRALHELNLEYEARFGFIFIVCATGKTAAEMLGLLRQRLGNSREREIALAAAEQRQITRLRLRGLLAPALR